jgi:hypothetical protein
MGKVRVAGFGVSIDGFGAGPDQSLEHPLGKGAGNCVGSGEAPIEGLASARRSNGSCSFPASRFHEWAFVI